MLVNWQDNIAHMIGPSKEWVLVPIRLPDVVVGLPLKSLGPDQQGQTQTLSLGQLLVPSSSIREKNFGFLDLTARLLSIKNSVFIFDFLSY
jgi:hypothetical protein